MTVDVLVVGGGLSGLSAAWNLDRGGLEVRLVESRPRLGGRVLTLASGDGCFDLGPSWVWSGQPYVGGLLRRFGLRVYEQWSEGVLLHELPDGSVLENAELEPMAGSRRIVGGVGALVEALAGELADGVVELGCRLRSLEATGEALRATLASASGESVLEARHVALALPPRLAARVAFRPPLPSDAQQQLESTPTWMAGHAKLLALYEAPFWREAGRSGEVLSRRGPMAEVHDASPPSGGPYALFGFVGIDADSRSAIGRATLVERCIGQLSRLFGPRAAAPLETHLVDWSEDSDTATPADRRFETHHPVYGLAPDLGQSWRERLHLIGTETAFADGGLVEGAVAQGTKLAASLLPDRVEELVLEDPADPHAASMDWDWLDGTGAGY